MLSREGGRMSLLEHFRELRKRVVRSAIAILLFSGAGWFAYPKIVNTLAKPICDLDRSHISGLTQSGQSGELVHCGVLGPLNLQVSVSFYVGLILSSPIWLYQLWAFVAPGLHSQEKRYAFSFIAVATPFFAGGAYLGYLVLPLAVKTLLGFTPASINNLVRFDDYLNFVLRLILVFGLAFELPVFLLALNFANVLSGKAILKPWRVAIFGITFFTAAFSPTGDPLTMSILALPLIILYFGAGVIALFNDRRRSKKQRSHE
jgi:sec-independent protein translocase protein TatC